MEAKPKFYIQSDISGEWVEVDEEIFSLFDYFGEIKMDEIVFGVCDRKTDEMLKEMGL